MGPGAPQQVLEPVAAPGWRTSLGDPVAVLSHILAATPDAIFAKDMQGRFVLVNQAFLEVLGRPADEVLGRTDADFLPPAVAAALRTRDAAVVMSGTPTQREETFFHARLGERRTFLCTTSVWRQQDGTEPGGVIVHAADVTDRVQATAELRRSSEAMYSGIVALASDAIITTDEHQNILLFNRGAEEIFGYSAAEVLGAPLDTLLPEPAREAHRTKHMREFAQGAAHARRMAERLQVQGRRKNGELFPAEVTVSRSSSAGAPRFSAILRDVTERRRLEEEMERQREELARSNTELEQFAYVASHDLQEPLRAVAAHTQLLQERYGSHLDDRARRHIGHAVEGARRMQGLINDLLALSRVGTHQRESTRVDLNAVLGDVIRALDLSAQECEAMLRCAPLPEVEGDAVQLSHVFLNLIGNALKFHRPDVAPKVTVRAERGGDEWVISVQDNGIGIDPAFSDRIFEVFKRLHTREEYPGTGIGLSICKKVIDRHGGRIWVEPAPDHGSIFRFTLPAVGAAAHPGGDR